MIENGQTLKASRLMVADGHLGTLADVYPDAGHTEFEPLTTGGNAEISRL